MSLPVLDLSKHTLGSFQDQERFGQELITSFQQHGFVKLVNHGLDREYIDQLMKWSRRFFRLPQAAKSSISNIKGLNPQRGYSGIGGENLKSFNLDGTNEDFIDVKEHFDQGPRKDASFSNQWPPETSENNMIGFRSFMESYFETISTLSLQLLSIVEKSLKLSSGTLTSRCNQNHNELRLNHYPATTIEDIKKGRVRRSGAHTDYGVLTFLVQDRNGGLQVQDRSAQGVKFVPVSAEDPSEVVINVADTLQRWTNGVLPAGLHQVGIPDIMQGETNGVLSERYSIAYFQKSNRAELVGSLPEFVSEKRPAKYENMTAIDYHKQRHALLYT